MDPRIIELFDEYTHRPLSRREFLSRLASLSDSAAAALAALPLLEFSPATAAQVSPEDPRLDADFVRYAGSDGPIKAYLARPAPIDTRLPAVLVIHENRGLNAHILDVTRRLAAEGFLAMAPDCLSPLGGTPADEDQAREMFAKLDAVKITTDLRTGLAQLKQHAKGNGKAGALGFCWGGGQVGELAVNAPELDAGVVYYGRQPKTGIERIRAPLLLHYAGLDARINEGIPAFETALKEARVAYTLHLYENVQHAFNNETSEARYDATAAALAWSRSVEFLRTQLRV